MNDFLEYLGVKGKTTKIVTFDEKKCKAFLDADGLRKIIQSRPEIQNLPTIMITIGGVTRSGKSFLLNLLVSYLAYLEEHGNDNNWMESSCTVKGVSWARSKKSITHGIWVFNRPFIVTRYDGKKAAVLLVDSQGTGDAKLSSTEVDTLITYIGLQISSVNVLNIKGGILNSDHLIQMQLCTEYADVDDDAPMSVKGTHEEGHLFRSLLFLIRDYVSDEDSLGDQPDLFPDMIKECQNPKLKKTAEGIRRVFCNVNAYQMPGPGDAIAKATAGSWKVKEVPKDFLRHVRGLARMLFALDQPTGGLSQCWESTTDLLNNFAMMKYHMENDELPPFTNPPDALQELIMHKAFAKLQTDFSDKIVQICQSDELTSFSTKEEVKQFYDRHENEALENFKKAAKYRKYEGKAIACKYLRMSKDFFRLMRERVMNKYDFLKIAVEIQKEREKFEIEKQEQEKRHREEINSLTSKIDGCNQRQQKSEAKFKAEKADMKDKITALRRTQEDCEGEFRAAKVQLMGQMEYWKKRQQSGEAESEAAKAEMSTQIGTLEQMMESIEGKNSKEKQELEKQITNLQEKADSTDQLIVAERKKTAEQLAKLAIEKDGIHELHEEENKPMEERGRDISQRSENTYVDFHETQTKQDDNIKSMGYLPNVKEHAVMGADVGSRLLGLPGGILGGLIGAAVGGIRNLMNN